MATVNPQQVSISGLEATYSAASGGGDRFAPGSNVFLHVMNGSGSDCEVTIVTTATVAGQAVGDVVVDVTAGEDRFIGPFQRQYFAGTGGLADVTWESTTSITFAVLRL